MDTDPIMSPLLPPTPRDGKAARAAFAALYAQLQTEYAEGKHNAMLAPADASPEAVRAALDEWYDIMHDVRRRLLEPVTLKTPHRSTSASPLYRGRSTPPQARLLVTLGGEEGSQGAHVTSESYASMPTSEEPDAYFWARLVVLLARWRTEARTGGVVARLYSYALARVAWSLGWEDVDRCYAWADATARATLAAYAVDTSDPATLSTRPSTPPVPLCDLEPTASEEE